MDGSGFSWWGKSRKSLSRFVPGHSKTTWLKIRGKRLVVRGERWVLSGTSEG